MSSKQLSKQTQNQEKAKKGNVKHKINKRQDQTVFRSQKENPKMKHTKYTTKLVCNISESGRSSNCRMVMDQKSHDAIQMT